MQIKPWQVLSSRVIHETPWIQVTEDECRSSDGKIFTYTYVKRKDAGPVIIAEENDGKIWLVQQYRHPVRQILWQLPAEGKMEGESWADAAQRGIEEEIGKTAHSLEDLGTLAVDPGGLNQVTHVFLAREFHSIQIEKYHHDENEVEHLNIAAFSPQEIREMMLDGRIADNWTLAALHLYDLKRS